MPDALPAATLPIYPGLGPASGNIEMFPRWLGYEINDRNLLKSHYPRNDATTVNRTTLGQTTLDKNDI